MSGKCDGGYVLAYRRIFSHHAFRSDAEALAFTYLTMKASWKTTVVRYKGRTITLQRGQLVVSLRDFANSLERSRQWAERFLNRLKTEAMIETTTEANLTVVTICNYDTYQSLGDNAETVGETSPSQDRDSTETQNNEVNKEKKGKKKKEESLFVLPDWIDADLWSKWEAHRKEIKAPLTDGAREGCVKTIKEAIDAGYTAEETINNSIVPGWRGLFVPKGKPKGSGEVKYPTPPDFSSRKAFLDYRMAALMHFRDNMPEIFEKYKDEHKALWMEMRNAA